MRNSNHRWRLTELSIAANAALATGKLALSILSFSVFMGIHAIYNGGIALAKILALTGLKEATGQREQYRQYSLIGFIVALASGLYVVYASRLLQNGSSTIKFPREIAISIAAFTFIEIGVNLASSLTIRRSGQPLMQALKLTNLAGSLLCLVLTQTALLSFSDIGNLSWANGLCGIFFGCIDAAIGLAMYCHGKKKQQQLII